MINVTRMAVMITLTKVDWGWLRIEVPTKKYWFIEVPVTQEKSFNEGPDRNY